MEEEGYGRREGLCAPQRDLLGEDLAEDEQQDRHGGDGGETAGAGEELFEEMVSGGGDGEVDERVAHEKRGEEKGRVVKAAREASVRGLAARADARALRGGDGEKHGFGA